MRLDPKLQHCNCGHTFRLSWYHYILMLFDTLQIRCPKCHQLLKFKMTYFVNQVYDQDVKAANKEIIEGKKRTWKNG